MTNDAFYKDIFPDVDLADEDGLLVVGGPIAPALVLEAYRNGIFPWPDGRGDVGWFAPPERALLFLDEVRINRSLRKILRSPGWERKINQNMADVIERCSEVVNRGDQGGTWISQDVKLAYKELHRLGFVHSVETYSGGQLVGGLYGVSIGGMFAGESMFYRESGASQVALIHLVEFLSGCGVKWIDCQVMTPFFKSVGARLVPRVDFMSLLRESLSKPSISWPKPPKGTSSN
jgi:leucyl/phenylalanyl-tRNA--protein transferase